MLRRRLPDTAKDFCRIPTSTLPCTFRILTTPCQGVALCRLRPPTPPYCIANCPQRT